MDLDLGEQRHVDDLVEIEVLPIGAGGALSSVQTMVLLTVEDTLAALQKASSIKYQSPGEKR